MQEERARVGSWIIMSDKADKRYSVTVGESIGIIVDSRENPKGNSEFERRLGNTQMKEFHVEFHHFGPKSGAERNPKMGGTFWISAHYFELCGCGCHDCAARSLKKRGGRILETSAAINSGASHTETKSIYAIAEGEDIPSESEDWESDEEEPLISVGTLERKEWVKVLESVTTKEQMKHRFSIGEGTIVRETGGMNMEQHEDTKKIADALGIEIVGQMSGRLILADGRTGYIQREEIIVTLNDKIRESIVKRIPAKMAKDSVLFCTVEAVAIKRHHFVADPEPKSQK